MKHIILKFKIWRRFPFKREITRAYSNGEINSWQMHELIARLDRV